MTWTIIGPDGQPRARAATEGQAWMGMLSPWGCCRGFRLFIACVEYAKLNGYRAIQEIS
jgi:hypothetical protein